MSDPVLVPIESAIALSKSVLFAACRRGEIPGAVKLGRRWLITRSGVERFVAARAGAVEDPVEADVRRRFRCEGSK